MSRTLTPRAQEILAEATKVLALAGYDIKHIADIYAADCITRATVIGPNVKLHELEAYLSYLLAEASYLLADASDYIAD